MIKKIFNLNHTKTYWIALASGFIALIVSIANLLGFTIDLANFETNLIVVIGAIFTIKGVIENPEKE